MSIKLLIKQQIEKLQNLLDKTERSFGEIIFNNNGCQVLSQSAVRFELIVDTESEEGQVEYVLHIFDEEIIPTKNSDRLGWNRYAYACLLQVENELHLLDPKEPIEHKKYSREGMIKRVMLERIQKAEKANYRIKWASNIYGNHILTNENGIKYKVFLRDFENETGYSDSMDSRLNKLGTTKHIMYAFRKLKEDKALFARLSKTYPFIEIFCDPLNEYKITWHYPSKIVVDEQLLLSRYFKNSSFIEDSELKGFLGFIEESVEYPRIRIRPEVQEKIETAFEEEMLENLKSGYLPDYSSINGELYPYQKEGIDFALFRKAAIIADEMALGMINNKTTAVRLIPVPGKEAGELVSFGGLFGASPIMPVRNVGKSSRFIAWGGRIPAPLHSFKN